MTRQAGSPRLVRIVTPRLRRAATGARSRLLRLDDHPDPARPRLHHDAKHPCHGAIGDRRVGAQVDPALAALLNHWIVNTAITFNPTPKTEAEILAMIADKAATGQADIVAITPPIIAAIAKKNPARDFETKFILQSYQLGVAMRKDQPELMKAAQSNIVHKNTASRKVSRLTHQIAKLAK